LAGVGELRSGVIGWSRVQLSQKSYTTMQQEAVKFKYTYTTQEHAA